MTTKALAVVVLASACATEPNPFAIAPHGEAIPPDVAAGCELANRRCSRCHSVERVLHAHISEPIEWQHYVHKMRLMPGSDIPPAEELVLTRCLVFRTSGSDGLTQLAKEFP